MNDLFKDKGQQMNLFGETEKEEIRNSLFDRFIVPPFSVFDGRQGYWQNRKTAWKSLGIKSEVGRAEHLCFNLNSFNADEDKRLREEGKGETTAPSTSVFDPVLCELAYQWFCPKGGKIIDPFAGGSVRGVVAGVLGRKYVGIDLRKEQIVANEANAKDICPGADLRYICADSLVETGHMDEGAFDFAFTCPPYYDLEVYSDDPHDISNMGWDGFLRAYEGILCNTARLLKDNSFFVIVIGDVRDKNGNYRRLPSLTQTIMETNGLRLYNDIVYLTPYGSAAFRAGSQFEASRKVCSTHQYFQVYVKGNAKIATNKTKG